MASTRVKGDMRDAAIKRIMKFFTLIGESEGIQPPTIQTFRDREYQEAMQLTVMADFGEALAISLGLAEREPEPEPVVETTEPTMMSFEEPPVPLDREHLAFTEFPKLIAIARENNIDLDPKWNKQEVMEAILATVEPPPESIEDTEGQNGETYEEAGDIGNTEPLDAEEFPADLDSHTVSELKAYADENGIDLDPKWNKQEVMEAILATVEPPPESIEDTEGQNGETYEEAGDIGNTEPLDAEEFPADLDSHTVSELKAYADENGIDLDGATKKADIIAAIEAAEAVEG